MENLEVIKEQLKSELADNDLKRLFYLFRQILNHQSGRYDDLNLLHSQYTSACYDQQIKGLLSYEEATLTLNRIKSSILYLINILDDDDLASSNLPDQSPPVDFNQMYQKKLDTPTSEKGSILYLIPPMMQIEQKSKCIVRISFEEKQLLKKIKKSNDSKLEPIRISELMEVKIEDDSGCDAFIVRSRSTPEQIIDRDDYTEWVIYVKPLREGKHDLILKVAVIEKKYDKLVRKEIVLEKKIEVVTEDVYEEFVLGKASDPASMLFGVPILPFGFETANQTFFVDMVIPSLTGDDLSDQGDSGDAESSEELDSPESSDSPSPEIDDYEMIEFYKENATTDNGWDTFYNEGTGEYYFTFFQKGEPILISEGYESKAARENGIQSVLENCDVGKHLIQHVTEDGKHYFTLKAANHQEIVKRAFALIP